MPNSLGVNPSTNWYHLSDFPMFVWSGVNIQREIPQMEPMTLHRLPRQARAQRRKMVERRGPGHISIWSEQFWTYLSFKARKKKNNDCFLRSTLSQNCMIDSETMAFLKIAKVNWIGCFLPSSNNPLPISQRAIKWLNQPNVSHQNSKLWIETIWWAMYTPLSVCNTPDFLRYISTQASKLVRKKHSVATVKGPAQVARSPAKISFIGSSGAYWFFCVYINIYI